MTCRATRFWPGCSPSCCRVASIRALYDPEPLIRRPIDEQVALVDLMARGAVEEAVALVRRHLEINEQRPELTDVADAPVSLGAGLAPYLAGDRIPA